MDHNTLKIAMAAFFHDLGKFAFPNLFEIPSENVDYKRTLYQPHNHSQYSHCHALHTVLFIESYSKWLPPELNASSWGEGDCFCNLAGMHHKPENPLQSIITQADRLTSGIDRQKFESDQSIHYTEYLKTRLLPMFEYILQDNQNQVPDDFHNTYPLSRLSPKDIFPVTQASLSKQEAKQEYEGLFHQFCKELKTLAHINQIELWFEHFESLAMVYLSAIPADRAGNTIPDVSLYDHLRLTSAFAAALFAYHQDNQTLNLKAIQQSDAQKFLMISGNFFGIQSFIFKGYGDTRKYRARLLRGRSFYVSLLVELAATLLCHEAGLPLTSIVLNAGGIFTILAPHTNRVIQAIQTVKSKINQWLIQQAYGELTFGFSYVPASENDFLSNAFTQLWDKMVDTMEKEKFNKINLFQYGGEISDYLNQFSKTTHDVCPICGIRPATTKISPENTPACKLCSDHISMGTQLVKHDIIEISHASLPSSKLTLKTPIFDHYQLRFLHSMDDHSPTCLKCWDISYQTLNDSGPCLKHGIARKIINAYVPVHEPDEKYDPRLSKLSEDERNQAMVSISHQLPKSFQFIAHMATTIDDQNEIIGMPALGILKADVDHLAMIMACGVPEKLYTLSRIATLSRQMNNFFALYLPALLAQDFQNIYTVFGGGDDLFLIGPYGLIFDLAHQLQQDFAQYVCHNQNIHFSAGIIVQKPGIPLDSLTHAAEHHLALSKHKGRNRLTVFGQTIQWQDMTQLNTIYNTLNQWLDQNYLSRSMLYKLNEFILMAEQERLIKDKICANDPVDLSDMHCLKWKSFLKYYGTRNLLSSHKNENNPNQNTLIHTMITQMTDWLLTNPSALRIPLWRVLYEMRK